jgi:hypothetical protein
MYRTKENRQYVTGVTRTPQMVTKRGVIKIEKDAK